MPETISTPAPANFIAGDWSSAAGHRTYERVNPHEQGRAAVEFYTEEVTVYRDV